MMKTKKSLLHKTFLTVLLTGVLVTGFVSEARATADPVDPTQIIYDPVALQKFLDDAVQNAQDAIAAAALVAAGQLACPGSTSLAPCCSCESTQNNLVELMDLHRRGNAITPSFLFGTFWTDTVSPAIQASLAKISATIWTRAAMVGSFYEAQNTVHAMSVLQQGEAQAARDFLPSEALCRFGTLGQTLAADDINSRTVQGALADMGLHRSLGTEGSISRGGRGQDKMARMDDFITEYCNPNENGADGLVLMCGTDAKSRFNTERDARSNKDLNYSVTMDTPQTLDLSTNLAKPNAETDDVINLAHNLYGSDQFAERLSDRDLRKNAGQDLYLKIRSVAATRSLTQNSYNAIAGLKAAGTGQSQLYMKNMYQELGLTEDQAVQQIGEKPSYYAQMNILTKKLYQNPNFYVNLMEGKTNVARQSGAMEGLELMQDRDIYNSMRRSEMLLAVLVQMQARKMLTKTIENVNTKGAK